MNSSGAAYEQMGTKFEKLHDGVAVLRTSLDDANLAENDTGELHPGVERAFHDETHDAQGGAMRIADSNCYGIHKSTYGGLKKILVRFILSFHFTMSHADI